MKRAILVAISILALSLGLMLAQQTGGPRLTADLVRGLEIRNITGTFSSGRIADVAIDPRNRSVWYVATASGGLWKTTNHGVTFAPIFDEGGAYSLGCVVLDPRNPEVVWLGTGENQAQRAIGWGEGVYKSGDAGKTWKRMGLEWNTPSTSPRSYSIRAIPTPCWWPRRVLRSGFEDTGSLRTPVSSMERMLS